MLKHMLRLNDQGIRKFIRTATEAKIDIICECFLNVVRGNVRVKIGKIEQYENLFRKLTSRKTAVETRRALLLSRVGFYLTKIIGQACLIHLSN